MSFKKNNINKTSPIIINTVWVIALFIIFLLWLFIIENITIFDYELGKKTNTWTTVDIKTSNLSTLNKNGTWVILKEEEKLKEEKEEEDTQIIKSSDKADLIKEYINTKNDKNKINILVVWRGWWDHDALNLTDTIILTSINTETKLISMLSIPRDLYVEYPESDNHEKSDWKINWLYAKYSFENDSSKIWMNILKRKVTEITWEKIDTCRIVASRLYRKSVFFVF